MDIIPQLIINSLITGSIYALASVGMALGYGLLRILNFAHGHLMMLGAYMFLWLQVENSLPLPLSTAGVFLIMGLAGWLTLRLFVAPVLNYSPLLPFVTTLALGTILESAVSMIFGVNVRSLSVNSRIESYEIFSSWAPAYITGIQILIIVSAIVILVSLALLLSFTPIGRAVRAISQVPSAAEALGIPRRHLITATFILAALMAAYAGVLVGYETNLQPTMGNNYTIKALAAMILGGLGNMWGTIVGSFILGFVENFGIGMDFWGYSLPAGYKDAFAYTIILLMLLVRPQGLLGKRSRGV